MYWTTTQVGEKVGEADSTIRYWCIEFADFLDISTVGPTGKKRLFKASDVNKMAYIKKLLKEERFSIRQVKEFLSTAEGEAMLPVEKAREQLVVEAVTRIVSQEMDRRLDKRFEDLQSMLMQAFSAQTDATAEIRELLQRERDALKEELAQEKNGLAERIDTLFGQEKERGERLLAMLEAEKVKKTGGWLANFFKKPRNSDTKVE